jgi:hypothetical protein
MIRREIINKKTGEILISFEDEDFEYENPVKHYEEGFVVKQMVLKGVPDNEMEGITEPSKESEKIFIEAVIESKKMIQKFKEIKVPVNLAKLFGSNKKAVQEVLLKGLVLTPDILMGFLIKAEESGYTLSQYISEHSPKGVDMSKMPLAYRVKKDGEVQTLGKTELSDGQLKQALENRKVTVAKFLDKVDEWHCFFVTFRSLKGGETWLGEKQPHYHYISNTFGLTRDEVVKQIKSEKYKLGSLPHIKLEGYGNQPNKVSPNI